MLVAVLHVAVFALPVAACGDEAAILAHIRSFFRTDDAAHRRTVAAQIADDEAYDHTKVRQWLHAAGLFEQLPVGRRSISVQLADGTSRAVELRIPKEYDAARPWPLIYALHGLGGSAADAIAHTQRLLGPQADDFVIAAPNQYVEFQLADRWPPIAEHRTTLRAVRRAVHVDADRVYAIGYSRGGHACWTLAVLMPDEFAGIVALAGSLLMPEIDALWPEFLPAAANTRVLGVWGEKDILDAKGQPSSHAGIAGLNRRLRELARKLELPIQFVSLPDVGHSGVEPPADALAAVLAARRVRYPADVQQSFRHISQAGIYWLEGHEWTGQQWDDQPLPLELRPGERPEDPDDVREAGVRAYRGRLGKLGGQREGQTLRVSRRFVKELTIWLGDELVELDKPVTVYVSSRKVFEGPPQRDLLVCLTQATRTYDFERLRWAGLRFRSGERTRPVSADD